MAKVSDYRKDIEFMSKKNRRKTTVQKNPVIPTSTFTADDSKVYIIATMIMFHILPLIFICFGTEGKGMLSMSYFTINPIFLSITGLIYGLKKGFNIKFPFVMAVLSILSIFMYGTFTNVAQETATVVIETITYTSFSYAAVIIGALLKKLFRF